MSDISQGEGWWLASDGKWYAPEQHHDYLPPPPVAAVQPPPFSQETAYAPPITTAQASPPFPTPPRSQVQGSPSVAPLGKSRSPAGVLGLSIVTLGIYYLYWYGTINGEIKRHDTHIKVTPGWCVVALFIPIANIVTAYMTAARIRQMQLDEGATQTISPVVALLLAIFLGIGYPLYVASQLSEHWHAHTVVMLRGVIPSV